MCAYFEAVAVTADESALVRQLESLSERADDRYAPITLALYWVADRRFVICGWRVGSCRPDAAEEMEDLADELSMDFGTAIAVHYNDQVGTLSAMLFRCGELIREFGEADEIWVPYGERGKLVTDGPRFAADAIPRDAVCGCITNGSDAAFEAAGFQEWLTTDELFDALASEEPVGSGLGSGIGLSMHGPRRNGSAPI